jgi:hypothetical protein
MSKKATAKKFDCVEMKRHIQERIYEETRGMKPDEFLAYMHQQVVESRFAAFFAGQHDFHITGCHASANGRGKRELFCSD